MLVFMQEAESSYMPPVTVVLFATQVSVDIGLTTIMVQDESADYTLPDISGCRVFCVLKKFIICYVNHVVSLVFETYA